MLKNVFSRSFDAYKMCKNVISWSLGATKCSRLEIFSQPAGCEKMYKTSIRCATRWSRATTSSFVWLYAHSQLPGVANSHTTHTGCHSFDVLDTLSDPTSGILFFSRCSSDRRWIHSPSDRPYTVHVYEKHSYLDRIWLVTKWVAACPPQWKFFFLGARTCTYLLCIACCISET